LRLKVRNKKIIKEQKISLGEDSEKSYRRGGKVSKKI